MFTSVSEDALLPIDTKSQVWLMLLFFRHWENCFENCAICHRDRINNWGAQAEPFHPIEQYQIAVSTLHELLLLNKLQIRCPGWEGCGIGFPCIYIGKFKFGKILVWRLCNDLRYIHAHMHRWNGYHLFPVDLSHISLQCWQCSFTQAVKVQERNLASHNSWAPLLVVADVLGHIGTFGITNLNMLSRQWLNCYVNNITQHISISAYGQ